MSSSQKNPARIVTCPTCEARVKWTPGNEFRPFCSERCKLIDLGSWADESHKIAGSSNDILSEELKPD